MCTKTRRVQRDSPKPVDTGEKTFHDLPIDVTVEVFRYLEPLDILHLARTTKGLRSFLLNCHRSRQVWTTAISNVADLPSCPDHLSEPAYTHLAFVPVCHGCFEYCDTIQWELRMRSCPNCVDEMTSLVEDVSLGGDEATQKARSVQLPVSNHHLELDESGRKVVSIKFAPICLPSDLTATYQRAQRTKGTIEAFVKKESKLWTPIIEHAKLCRKWEKERLNTEAERLGLVREKRMNMIQRNLSAQGWANETYYSSHIWKLPEVKKTVPLTAAEWSEIYPKLIPTLLKAKCARIADTYRHRLQLFGDMVKVLCFERDPGVEFNAIDFFVHPDIRHVLEDVNAWCSYNTMQQQLEPILSGIVQRWYDDAIADLTSLAQRQLGHDVTVDPSSVKFVCTQCKVRMDLVSALSHEHLYSNYVVPEGKEMDPHMRESEIYEEIGKEVYKSYPRNLDILQTRKASQRIGALADKNRE